MALPRSRDFSAGLLPSGSCQPVKPKIMHTKGGVAGVQITEIEKVGGERRERGKLFFPPSRSLVTVIVIQQVSVVIFILILL